jgi:COP9 signalosome complex subunit 3
MSQPNLPTPPEQPTPQHEPDVQQQPSPVQSQAPTQTQVPTPPTGSTEHNISLVNIITAITTAASPSYLNQQLKTFAPKEVRDVILASLLPDGQDPLSVLDIQANTLGILHIL